jgi:hypothetical protein
MGMFYPWSNFLTQLHGLSDKSHGRAVLGFVTAAKAVVEYEEAAAAAGAGAGAGVQGGEYVSERNRCRAAADELAKLAKLNNNAS